MQDSFVNAMGKDSLVSLHHLQTPGNAPALLWDAWAHPSEAQASLFCWMSIWLCSHPAWPTPARTAALRWICLFLPSTTFGKGVGEGKQPSSLILHLHI